MAPAPRWWAAIEEVADRIEEYAALGIGEFVLSGYPHLEEAYWFGEGVLPVLRERGLWSETSGQSAVVGEVTPAGERRSSVPFTVGRTGDGRSAAVAGLEVAGGV